MKHSFITNFIFSAFIINQSWMVTKLKKTWRHKDENDDVIKTFFIWVIAANPLADIRSFFFPSSSRTTACFLAKVLYNWSCVWVKGQQITNSVFTGRYLMKIWWFKDHMKTHKLWKKIRSPSDDAGVHYLPKIFQSLFTFSFIWIRSSRISTS